MATAALWVASGWLPPAALAVARHPEYLPSERLPYAFQRRDAGPPLCQDTSGYVIEQLWPSPPCLVPDSRTGPQAQAKLSPRSFESRLRSSAPILQDLQQVAAVSQTWAQRIDSDGWSAAHAYLYQEPGTKVELRQRYAFSVRELLVKDWFKEAWPVVSPGAASPDPEGVVARVVSFMVPP
eukprot:gb/GFBE01072029.1/.p1 GENE.gb/GFBE01072029.1/~~gb/GFBE01072029.1/.p1  ORF type:complete len:181 (+),score=28.77 gb/GFBE01072029.1/:1-543(+)